MIHAPRFKSFKFVPFLTSLVVGALLLQPADAVLAQTSTIRGTVTSAGSRRPIVGAQLAVRGTNIVARSDSGGQFAVRSVSPGQYELHIMARGYQTDTLKVAVGADQIIDLSITLKETTRAGRSPFRSGAMEDRVAGPGRSSGGREGRASRDADGG